MDKGEYVGGRGVLGQGRDDGGVGEEIAGIGAFKGAGLDIKDVDEDTDIAEGLGFLRCEVGLCEGVLSVPFQCISQCSAI